MEKGFLFASKVKIPKLQPLLRSALFHELWNKSTCSPEPHFMQIGQRFFKEGFSGELLFNFPIFEIQYTVCKKAKPIQPMLRYDDGLPLCFPQAQNVLQFMDCSYVQI
ncbi:Uncharacterised protein [Propionibacterium australiense]|nr:Uncharacterised protein [Propionibacterium australiense]